jgi:hypothetical protein
VKGKGINYHNLELKTYSKVNKKEKEGITNDDFMEFGIFLADFLGSL